MSRTRRIGQRGRISETRRQTGQPSPPGQPASKSQAPAHGQGLGVGLALLSLGAKPGGQGGAAAASAPAFSASAQTARPGANVNSLAVTLPTYSANDHVMILICGPFLTGTDTASAAGWTQDGAPAIGNQIAFVFHRKMTGSEGANVTFNFSTAFERPFAIAATYSGASGLEASIITGSNSNASTWSLANVVTTGPSRTAVALVYSFSGNAGTDFTTVNGGATKRIDVANATDPGGFAAAAIIADLSARTAGNYTMSGSLNNATAWLGVLVALKP